VSSIEKWVLMVEHHQPPLSGMMLIPFLLNNRSFQLAIDATEYENRVTVQQTILFVIPASEQESTARLGRAPSVRKDKIITG
jgi:hypothetical protein